MELIDINKLKEIEDTLSLRQKGHDSLIIDFIDNVKDLSAEIKICLEKSDIDTAKTHLHSLKGVIGIFGAKELQDRLESLHNFIKEQNNSSQELLSDFTSASSKTIDYFKSRYSLV
jgi:HPt (histidine-containing phosphotransfer) domain-containing protein